MLACWLSGCAGLIRGCGGAGGLDDLRLAVHLRPPLCAPLPLHFWPDGDARRLTRSDPDLILDADKHPSGKILHIYLGDRWNGHGENGGVGNASYVWLPLVPEPSSPAKFSMPELDGGGNGEWQIAKY